MPKTRSSTSLQVVDGDHIRGADEAPATMIVYGDYECPFTRKLELSLAHLRWTDGNVFRLVFRYFPLREIHPHAENAARAAESVYALRGADAFWVMHDGLFAHQDELDSTGLERQAETAGVTPVALRAMLDTSRIVDRVERDVRSGTANGVEGTPTIFVDGERYSGQRDAGSLRDFMTAKARAGRGLG